MLDYKYGNFRFFIVFNNICFVKNIKVKDEDIEIMISYNFFYVY